VKLKPTDPEAADSLRRADIAPYELFAAGHGDPSKVPAQLVAVIGDSRLRNWSVITSLALSADGQTLATGGKDQSAIIWDLATGKMSRPIDLGSHSDLDYFVGYAPSPGLALSPDGRTLATAEGTDHSIKLWDTKTGQQLRSLKRSGPSDDQYLAVAFSPPNGRLVAGGGSTARHPNGAAHDGIVTLWDLKTGRVQTKPAPPDFYVIDCFFDRTGKTVIAHLRHTEWVVESGTSVSVSHEAVMAWSVSTGHATFEEVKGQAAPEMAKRLRFGPDLGADTPYSTTSREAVSLLYRANGPSVRAGGAMHDAAEPRLVVIDLTTGIVRGMLDLSADLESFWNRLCALRPDGKSVCLWTSEPKGLLFWNVDTGEKHRPAQSPSFSEVVHGRYSLDGTKLALSERAGGTIIWDIAGDKELLPRGGFRGAAHSVRFSPDGAHLAIEFDDCVVLWDIAARSETRRFGGDGPVAISLDWRTLALRQGSKVILYEVATGREKLVAAVSEPSNKREDRVWAFAFSPDGQSLALGYGNGKLVVRDTSTGKVAHDYQGISSFVSSIAFSPDGRQLAAAGRESESRPLSQVLSADVRGLLAKTDRVFFSSSDQTVQLWNMATGQKVQTIPGVGGPVAFSPDGHTLSTGKFGYSLPLPLWDPATGRLRRLIDRHTPGDACAVFSSSGRTLATWGGGNSYGNRYYGPGDGTLRLWDATSGDEREVIRLCRPGGSINQVAFSPTGRHLATANPNGTVYILRVEDR